MKHKQDWLRIEDITQMQAEAEKRGSVFVALDIVQDYFLSNIQEGGEHLSFASMPIPGVVKVTWKPGGDDE